MSCGDDVELAWALDDLYAAVCSKCKYHGQCQRDLYDCPAIIRLAKLRAIIEEGVPERRE